ncbi:sulfite exporter TauE/SafE family protein [Candidatus Actinomarina]|nr:sulfite exporter TauE/SafE family protein [Candidatus Actinomarina sp.]
MLPLFIIGSVGGFLSGILGIGGGVVFVPLLTYFTDQDFKINTGISSMAVVFVATTSSITYISKGQTFSSYILYLILGGILGGYLGSKLTFSLDTKTLQRIFAILLLGVSYRMIFTSEYSSQYEESIILYLLIGIFSGILSGLLGIGGGIVRIPLLIFFGGLENLAAQGFSLIATVPTALTAAYTKLRNDREFAKRGSIVGISGILGSVIGGNLAFNLPQEFLNTSFAVFLLIVSVNMLLKTAK